MEESEMNRHEANYSIIELEALVVVGVLKKFRPYIAAAGTALIITY